VRFSPKPVSAMQTSHIETDLREAPLEGVALSVAFKPQQLQSFRIQFDPPSRR
jgi:hypothetical protein